MQFQKPSINSNFDRTVSQHLDPVKEETPALIATTNISITSPTAKVSTPTHAVQAPSPMSIPTKEEMKMYFLYWNYVIFF